MYIIETVPNDILEKLDKEINKQSLQKHNYHLAGNIKKELAIPEAKKHLLSYLPFLVGRHIKEFNTFEDALKIINVKEPKLELLSVWVNYQKKHEFNPLHDHGGLFSFVIWHKVPYYIEDEFKFFPDMRKDSCRAGYFSFVYPDKMGEIKDNSLPVDKTWEGKIALFPSKLKHLVYPFYSSDDERISISGNLILRI